MRGAPAGDGGDAGDRLGIERCGITRGEALGQQDRAGWQRREIDGLDVQQCPEESIPDITQIVGTLGHPAVHPLELSDRLPKPIIDGVFGRCALADRAFDVVDELGIIEKLEVGLEDGSLLLADALGGLLAGLFDLLAGGRLSVLEAGLLGVAVDRTCVGLLG